MEFLTVGGAQPDFVSTHAQHLCAIKIYSLSDSSYSEHNILSNIFTTFMREGFHSFLKNFNSRVLEHLSSFFKSRPVDFIAVVLWLPPAPYWAPFPSPHPIL